MQKLLFTLLLVLFCNQNFQTSTIKDSKSSSVQLILKVKVIGIKDGDTVEVLYKKSPMVVRLEHIDAPEKKQDYGSVSSKKLSNLIFGKTVILISKGKKGNFDRNKRMIAEIVRKDGMNVNLEMVKCGLAWHYKKYSSQKIYSDFETVAKKNKLGLWQDQYAISPWEFRQNKKSKQIPKSL